MNQILDYSPDKSSSKNSSKSDNIVRVFAIILAIFAISLISVGVYSLNKNESSKFEDIPVKKSKPSIQVLRKENALEINIIHDKELSKVFYCWDNDKEMALNINGSEVHEQISLLAGEHDLIVKATDIDGESSTFNEKYTSTVGEDKEKPVIEHTEDETRNKVIIKATDETEISYITYRWDDDDETKVEVEEEGQKEIIAEIDLDISKNGKYLTVIAVDKSNNSASWGDTYSIIVPPTIKEVIVSEDKQSVNFYITDENGIKEIIGQRNDTQFIVDLKGENPKEYGFTLPLDTTVDVNNVKIKIVNVSGINREKEFNFATEKTVDDNITITLEVLESNPSRATAKIESPDGIKEIHLNINGSEVDCDIGDIQPEELKTVPFELGEEYGLVQGNNKITFRVVKPDGTEKVETKEIYLEQ